MDKKNIYTQSFKQWFGDWENGNGSLVVDENGLPLVVYHGSNSDFDIFDSKFMGQNGTAIGQGFYFTSDKNYAHGYGDNVKPFYLNIRKPLSKDNITITYDELYKLINEIDMEQVENDKDYGYGILSDYGDVDYEGRENVLKKAVKMEYNSSDNDVELIGGLINASGNYDIVTHVLFNTLGYDGVIDKEHGLYVIHNSNQSKLINNESFSNSKNIKESKMKRIFINEKQLNIFQDRYIYENVYFIDTEKVNILKNFLNKYFTRGTMDNINSNGYPQKTNVIGMKNNNGDVIKNLTFEQMLDLMEDKFHYIYTNKEKRKKFLTQVLKDWYNKKISKEGMLSVNNY